VSAIPLSLIASLESMFGEFASSPCADISLHFPEAEEERGLSRFPRDPAKSQVPRLTGVINETTTASEIRARIVRRLTMIVIALDFPRESILAKCALRAVAPKGETIAISGRSKALSLLRSSVRRFIATCCA